MISGLRGASASVSLCRKVNEGLIIPIKRGVYTLNSKIRKVALPPHRLANLIVEPSYLSGIWAMAYRGVIPEMVCEFTSVTTGFPSRKENSFGRYSYQQIAPDKFWGCERCEDGALIATSEKALLDWIYLSRREMPYEQIETELRIQSDCVNVELLQEFAEKMNVARVSRMVLKIIEGISEDAESWSVVC